MSDPQGPPGRSEPREVIELRRLKDDQPELAAAANLQIELIQLQRRVQSRLRLPSIKLEPEYLNSLLGNGTDPAVRSLWSSTGTMSGFCSARRRPPCARTTRWRKSDYRRAEALARDADTLPAAIAGVVRVGAAGRCRSRR